MALRRSKLDERKLEGINNYKPLLRELLRAMELFSAPRAARTECARELENLLSQRMDGAPQLPKVVHVEVDIVEERHIVDARTKARVMAVGLGFSRTEQVKIATAVSELARNIYHYAGPGKIILRVVSQPRRGLVIEALDKGPGIADLERILAGRFRSRTGLGLGLRGCKNLMDEFSVDTSPETGTHVRTCKYR
ncbi:MAG: anti-sigma regulatory factor [Nannocystaceae bacterium]